MEGDTGSHGFKCDHNEIFHNRGLFLLSLSQVINDTLCRVTVFITYFFFLFCIFVLPSQQNCQQKELHRALYSGVGEKITKSSKTTVQTRFFQQHKQVFQLMRYFMKQQCYSSYIAIYIFFIIYSKLMEVTILRIV